MEEEQSINYFFEQVEQNAESNTRVDIDSIKNVLSEQRRIYRDDGGKKEFLEMISSANFDSIHNKIDIELKKLKEKNKKLKERLNHKKEEKRKHRRDSEKIISEIFKLKQEINLKKINLVRLNQESVALKNKQEKKLTTNNNKYSINELIDEVQCKNILNQQKEILNTLNNNINKEKTIINQEKSANNKLNLKHESLNKKIRTLKDMIFIQENKSNESSANNAMRNSLEKELESLKRLLSIQTLEIDEKCNKLCIEFKSLSNEIYKILILIESYQRNENVESLSYSIKSIEITNQNNTKFTAIQEFVMSAYKYDANTPMITIKRAVIEILLCLKRLDLRYRDIKQLEHIYANNDRMLPWLPENGQLVFKFSFTQNIKNENVYVVVADIPLVIAMSWNYPQHKCMTNDNVITIEHYICNLTQKNKNNMVNMSEIEAKWKDVLEKVMSDIAGRFQSDIVSFVNFIHAQLQRFADIDQ